VDADVIVVGAGLAGLVATAELADAGKRVLLLARSRRATSAGRRSGPSAACSSSTLRSSGGWASATRSSWPGRTGRAAPASTAWRTTGRGSGRRPTSTSRRGRSAPGCTPWGCGGSRSSDGPSAAATPGTATATPCRASTSPAAPDPVWSLRSSVGCAPGSPARAQEVVLRVGQDQCGVSVRGLHGASCGALWLLPVMWPTCPHRGRHRTNVPRDVGRVADVHGNPGCRPQCSRSRKGRESRDSRGGTSLGCPQTQRSSDERPE
jgi:hypothetical protein